MVEIKANFIIGTEKSNPGWKYYRILNSISWDIGDSINVINNVIYSTNGKHSFALQLKLWLIRFLFRRDFKFIEKMEGNK